MSENNKKTPRTFQCRDALWQKFEEMARELECSVDYLINDSMKQYARQRGFASAGAALAPQAVSLSSSPPNPERSSPIASSPRPVPVPLPAVPSVAPPAVPPAAVAPPVPPPIPGRSLPAPPAPPGPPPGRAALPSLGPVGRASAGPGGPQTVPLPPNRIPPPPGAGARLVPPPAAHKAGGNKLVVHFEGNEYPVTKEQFVIGRGKQVSDLTIRDPNISRQHAAIEFSGGSFWMVDMGSTNGVEFNGQRVQRKQIQNGEIYRICSHELLMSLS